MEKLNHKDQFAKKACLAVSAADPGGRASVLSMVRNLSPK